LKRAFAATATATTTAELTVDFTTRHGNGFLVHRATTGAVAGVLPNRYKCFATVAKHGEANAGRSVHPIAGSLHFELALNNHHGRSNVNAGSTSRIRIRGNDPQLALNVDSLVQGQIHHAAAVVQQDARAAVHHEQFDKGSVRCTKHVRPGLTRRRVERSVAGQRDKVAEHGGQ